MPDISRVMPVAESRTATADFLAHYSYSPQEEQL